MISTIPPWTMVEKDALGFFFRPGWDSRRFPLFKRGPGWTRRRVAYREFDTCLLLLWESLVEREEVAISTGVSGYWTGSSDRRQDFVSVLSTGGQVQRGDGDEWHGVWEGTRGIGGRRGGGGGFGR